MATGYAQFQHESLPGNEFNTPTLSTKIFYPRLQAFTPDEGSGQMVRDDELLNTDEPVSSILESFDPNWSLESRGYPDLVGMMLAIALGLPTTTVGNGIITDPDAVAIPTGAYKHVWTAPFGPTGTSPKTAQIQLAYKDNPIFYKFKGAAINQITIDTPPSGGMSLKIGGPANYFIRIADPALTPTFEADTIQPFLRANLVIPTWLASTGITADFGVVIDCPVEAHHTAGSGSKYPDATFKGDTPIMVSGSMPKEILNAADWDALIAGTTFAAKARWQSLVNIVSTYPYKFYVEGTAAQYQDANPEPLSNKRRIGGSFGFKYTRAGSTSATLTLVNGTPSYA